MQQGSCAAGGDQVSAGILQQGPCAAGGDQVSAGILQQGSCAAGGDQVSAGILQQGSCAAGGDQVSAGILQQGPCAAGGDQVSAGILQQGSCAAGGDQVSAGILQQGSCAAGGVQVPTTGILQQGPCAAKGDQVSAGISQQGPCAAGGVQVPTGILQQGLCAVKSVQVSAGISQQGPCAAGGVQVPTGILQQGPCAAKGDQVSAGILQQGSCAAGGVQVSAGIPQQVAFVAKGDQVSVGIPHGNCDTQDIEVNKEETLDDELSNAETFDRQQEVIESHTLCQKTTVFTLSRSSSTTSIATLTGDPLHEWYSSSDQDWEECHFVVPGALSSLQACSADVDDDPNIEYVLEAVSWDGCTDLGQQLDVGINQHRVVAQVLEEEDEEGAIDGLGDVGEMQKKGVARMCKLEASNRSLQEVLYQVQIRCGSNQLQWQDRLAFLCNPHSPVFPGGDVCLRSLHSPEQSSHDLVTPVEEFLQTKAVPNEVVRADLNKWKPAMIDEYNSLVHETKAVRPLSDSEFAELTRNPDVRCELIPGRAIFTIKAQTGRLKARVVACGCFQIGASRTKEDTFASGVSAESVRMLVRLAGLRGLKIGSLDIKTAFLNAPVVTPNRETVVVRVPAILRASNTCSEKYWVVDKAIYGLDVSPRSWVIHRNGVLTGIESLSSGRKVRCLPMEEDANVWVIVDTELDKVIVYLALYVDDVLIVGEEKAASEVSSTLEQKWTTTPVTWATEKEAVVFDGFEVTFHEGVYHVSQSNYTREVLSQHEEVSGTCPVPSTKEVHVPDIPGSRQEHIKVAQALAGQLLWLSGRTRPDIAYAASQIGQLIVHDPMEAVTRAHQVIRYLRHLPDVCLKYGPAPNNYGTWDQLQWKQDSGGIDLFSDASFMADGESRSFGASQMFWAGGLIMWHCSRQPLISASTAEAELIAMAEAFAMGRSLKPLIEAFCVHADITCRSAIYTDNSAALQLCTLDAGSWRTRHLRLRGHMIREAIERGEWNAAHLEGVYMPADIGTKSLGMSRFEDLLGLLGLHCPHLQSVPLPPNSKVASIKTGIAKVLIALILVTKPVTASAQSSESHSLQTLPSVGTLAQGFLLGFGGYFGWMLGRAIHRGAEHPCCKRRRPVCSELHQGQTTIQNSRIGEGVTSQQLALLDSQTPRAASASASSNQHVVLLDSQPPKAASPSTSFNRHVELLDSQPPKAASPSASSNRHVELLDSQTPKAASPSTSFNRHEELLDSQPPKAASASASSNRHVVLLDSQPPKAASPSTSFNRHVELLDSQPPKAASASASSNRHVELLDSQTPKAASASASSNRHVELLDSQPPKAASASASSIQSACRAVGFAAAESSFRKCLH